MTDPYQERIAGELLPRAAPGQRHERICGRLHEALLPALAENARYRLLPPREPVQLQPNSVFRPDLTLVDCQSGGAWLCAEVIDSVDHLSDTVHKKAIYEDVRLPRLWIVDPRYDNVEIYQASAFGIVLREILGRRQHLQQAELPGFRLALADLFAE